jgi:hypothetical protein
MVGEMNRGSAMADDASLWNKPITPRGLMHVALFVCFFPFSMLVYFPRTSLVIAGAIGIGAILLLGAMR